MIMTINQFFQNGNRTLHFINKVLDLNKVQRKNKHHNNISSNEKYLMPPSENNVTSIIENVNNSTHKDISHQVMGSDKVKFSTFKVEVPFKFHK